MDFERKINLCEGVPLNSGAANLSVNTAKSHKVNTADGTEIQKTEKPSDFGVHITTTFSIASSKKIKLIILLNFLMCVICIIVSCSMAIYCWNEMISMRRQLYITAIQDQMFVQSLGHDRPVSDALVAPQRPVSNRVPRLDSAFKPQNTKTYYVEDLGDEDMLLADSKKKESSDNNNIAKITVSRELPVAHFNGGISEIYMDSQASIGPWVRDNISSKNSKQIVDLNNKYFIIKESGLYLIYIQIVYLSNGPNHYFLWATQASDKPRLLTTCHSADVTTPRPLEKSQMSCTTQTVARLYKNDVLNLAQREPDRTLWLRPGYSYFGFIKLNS